LPTNQPSQVPTWAVAATQPWRRAEMSCPFQSFASSLTPSTLTGRSAIRMSQVWKKLMTSRKSRRQPSGV
jgi:hypothetical protein